MRAKLVAASVVFLLAMPIFCHRVGFEDHLYHLEFAQKMMRRELIVPHPLFHVTLLALMGGDPGGSPPLAALGVVAFILSAALAARAWLTLIYIKEPLPPVAATALCLALTVALPLPNWWHGHPYNGGVTPNAWHSPTGIFAVPFCLALFLYATRLLERPSPRAAILTGVVATLGLLAKPNYFLALAPCFGVALLATLWRAPGRPASKLGVLALAFGPPAVVLTTQYVWLASDSSILFAPFAVWNAYTHEHMLGSVLIGIAFPLAVVLCYPRQINNSQPLVLAWGTLLVGIGTYACFAEQRRLTEGNFSWGMIFADQVLFVASTAFVLQQRRDWRQACCLVVLGLHVLAGIKYPFYGRL